MSKLHDLPQQIDINLKQWAKELDKLGTRENVEQFSSLNDTITTMQLVLELQLNCQDALTLILKLERCILDFLGIQPNQASSLNLERMTYTVGHEDIKDLINIIALVEGALSKLLIKDKKESFSKSSTSHTEKTPKIMSFLKNVAKQQLEVVTSIQKLERLVKMQVKYQQVGPVFDEIAALRGPVNQFYQAMLHGLGQLKQVHSAVKKKNNLQTQLSSLLRKLEKEFKPFPLYDQPVPNYQLRQFDKQLTHEQLEERARAKRMRPFFS